jgi:3-oxoacyl-[acyl-carrier-protein] synthase-1
MSKKVYITGNGIVSSLGFDVAETLDSVLNSRSGIAPLTYLKSRHRGEVLAGEVKATNKTLLNQLKLIDNGTYSRTALLGIMAARQAFQQANLAQNTQLRTGLISSTTVGGVDRSEIFYNQKKNEDEQQSVRVMLSHDCGDSTERIADDLGISDYVTTISTACSSSANAILLGARMIKQGVLDRVLVGGTDALTAYTLNGFRSLKILDEKLCRPFDDTREGLNLGEGAAFLVLESEKSLAVSKNKPLGKVAGYGNANDAFHQTASSPEGLGALSAMRKALRVSELELKEIDYVNVHGTGTPNNDQSEGRAMWAFFGGGVPKFSSTKSFTGHTLAPAGVIEAVLCLLSMNRDVLLPNLNFKTPMAGIDISPITKLQRDVDIRNVLSNSFGFGGNCTSLIFSKM